MAENFKTVYGKEYKDATVSRVEPDGLVLRTKSGISKVYFVELPKEVQQRFHYDAAKAAQFTTAQEAGVEQLNAATAAQQQQLAAERQRQAAAIAQQQQQAQEQQRQAEAIAEQQQQQQFQVQQKQGAKIAAQEQARQQHQRKRTTTGGGYFPSESSYTHYDPVTGVYDSYHRSGNAQAGSYDYEHREPPNPMWGTTNVTGGSASGPPPKRKMPKKHETPSP